MLSRVPLFLTEFSEGNSAILNDLQEKFAKLVNEFQDVFTEDLVVGNCSGIEHSINVKGSSPIKQVLRRIADARKGREDFE